MIRGGAGRRKSAATSLPNSGPSTTAASAFSPQVRKFAASMNRRRLCSSTPCSSSRRPRGNTSPWRLRGVLAEQHYTCYACAIMPDHVHILIRKHRHQAEEIIERLKEESRLRLVAAGQRCADHPTWTGGVGWKVFLDHPDEVRRTI